MRAAATRFAAGGMLGCWFLFCVAGCGGGGGVEGGGGGPGGGGPRRATLLLNWLPEAEHGGFYAALLNGHYRDAGLDVTIEHGGPGRPVSPQIDRKRYTFGVENGDKLLIARARGAEVVALMAPLRDSPRCVLVHEDSGIGSLSELKDVTLAMSAEDPFAKYLRARVPLTGVNVVAFSGGVKGFVARRDYAQQGYVFSEAILARRQGARPRVLALKEIGFNPYTSVLVAHRETVEGEPELARAMALASARGWKDYLRSPAEVNVMIARENPEMDLELLNEGAAALREYCGSMEEGDEEFGAMSSARWSELARQLEEVGAVGSDAATVSALSAERVMARVVGVGGGD